MSVVGDQAVNGSDGYKEVLKITFYPAVIRCSTVLECTADFDEFAGVCDDPGGGQHNHFN
jgi:hypothetical protein